MEMIFLLLLIVLNGVFAMSEIAVVTARKLRLNQMIEAGSKSAQAALDLHEQPTSFLSSVQIGITSIGILNGIVGEAALARPLALSMAEAGMDPETSQVLATIGVVVLITYVSIVIGELVPKRLAQLNPEKVAARVALPMQWLSRATHPFVRLLSWSTDRLVHLLHRGGESTAGPIEDEVRALLEEGTRSGIVHQDENQMVRNVMRLDERPVKALMVHHADIHFLDVNADPEINRAALQNSRHSLYPVCEGGLDRILGLVHTKQLLLQCLEGQDLDLHAALLPAEFLPDTVSGMDLLNHFRNSRARMVFIVDEYGELEGLATPQDVLRTVVGSSGDPDDPAGWAFQRQDGSWLLDGLIGLSEVQDLLELKRIPDTGGDYHTLAGLILAQLGKLPATGDTVFWDGWLFEIVDMDERRVDKVLASRATEPSEADETETVG